MPVAEFQPEPEVMTVREQGDVVVLHPRDNVATAIRDLERGATVRTADGRVVTLAGAIPFGHKVALERIARGGKVIKYGEIIGLATADIARGEHVHVHNVEGARGRGDRWKETRDA